MASRVSIPALLLASACLAVCGCHMDMVDQPKIEALEASELFRDGRGARPLPRGVVPRGGLHEDDAFWRGVGEDGRPVAEIPVPVTPRLLERGRERYEIFCSPCHDRAGTGHGMVVQRGMKPPPSFHTQRLRESPAGHFHQVIGNGYGLMYGYGNRVPPADRWAVVAWIRALQLSQYAPAELLDAGDRDHLDEEGPAP